MSRVCEVCGKKTQFGRSIERRGLAKKKGGVGKKITGISIRAFKANIQNVRAWVNGRTVRMRVCANCVKSGRIVKPPRREIPDPKPA
jgi:large subunit ribosomal protein L28